MDAHERYVSRSVAKSNHGRPLRVLHLGRFFEEEKRGGMERHIHELLQAMGDRVTSVNLVAAPGIKGGSITHDSYTTFMAPSLGVFASTAVSPAMIQWARRLHAIDHFDLIHLHFPNPMAHLVSEFMPRGLKRVVSWHMDIVRQRVLQKLYQPLLNPFLAAADAVVAATPAHFSESTQLYRVKESHRHVIAYGIDFREFNNPEALSRARALRAFATNGADVAVIFSVGRHVYYKGFDFLVRAMKQIPNARLVLGGAGPLSKDLETLARSCGVADRVLFTGRLSDQELRAWYHACDIFCLPSSERTEAFGLVQLEAMACGKPVVNTRLGNGVNEVSLDGITGLTAQPKNAPSLASCLNQLISQKERAKEMGRAGLGRATELFSADVMADRMIELYQGLCSTKAANNC